MEEITRRNFLSATAKACFGVGMGGSAAHYFSGQALADDVQVIAAGGGKAKSVIYLYLGGGLSHVDSLDPKPDSPSEYRGDTKAISTKIAGIQLGNHFPALAKQADKFTIIRNMNSTQGAHGPGVYYTRTGYQARGSIVHPTAGAWVQKLKEEEKALTDLPGYVSVNGGSAHPGGGFFDPQFSPLPIGAADSGLQFSHHRLDVTENEFARQLAFRKKLDLNFDAKYAKGTKKVRAYNEMYHSAVKIMESDDLKAFNISEESDLTHELYGEDAFSKGCLLSRRLVEHGVRFVDVTMGGFDWHVDNHEKLEEMGPIVDQAVAALIHDLSVKGLLDSTMVVLASEFGRTPKINQNAGRDHYPKAYSTLVAGGGIKGGRVFGETDKLGSEIIGSKVSPPDLNATIAFATGVDANKELMSASKRPFKMAGEKGKAVTELFS